jgi:hypothetical protein
LKPLAEKKLREKMAIPNSSTSSPNSNSEIKTRITIQSSQQSIHQQQTPSVVKQPMTFHLGEEAIGGAFYLVLALAYIMLIFFAERERHFSSLLYQIIMHRSFCWSCWDIARLPIGLG